MLQKKRINAIYCRVSTDTQQTGLESQIRALKDWCFRNQITEYELFADEGVSGAKESRPALNRLMAMVETDEVEQIIVFSFSRFARSTSHLLKGLKIFKEKNTRFISITESIDTNSPLGVALYTILGQSIKKIVFFIAVFVILGCNCAQTIHFFRFYTNGSHWSTWILVGNITSISFL
ncbi:MAG: recombinase family protein [Pseudobdellovibrionaceae bacterium]